LEATLTSSLGRTTLSSSPVSIGRASDNQLIIDDTEASAHHAEIKPSPDGAVYLVTDQSSTNGTFVNEERLPIYTPRVLNTGDIIRIGSLHFTYEMISIINPYEPASAASIGYDPTVAFTPNAISNSTTNASQTQSAQPLAASTNPETPPQQPSYPEQPYAELGPSGPPPIPGQFDEPRRPKRRIGLWITLAIVVVLVIGGSALGVLYYVNRSTPTKTLEAFCTNFKKGDAQGFYNVLSSHAQAQTNVDQLKALFALTQSSGGIRDCKVSNVQEHGSTATGKLVLALNDGRTSQPFVEHVINEGGTWKVDESPN